MTFSTATWRRRHHPVVSSTTSTHLRVVARRRHRVLRRLLRRLPPPHRPLCAEPRGRPARRKGPVGQALRGEAIDPVPDPVQGLGHRARQARSEDLEGVAGGAATLDAERCRRRPATHQGERSVRLRSHARRRHAQAIENHVSRFKAIHRARGPRRPANVLLRDGSIVRRVAARLVAKTDSADSVNSGPTPRSRIRVTSGETSRSSTSRRHGSEGPRCSRARPSTGERKP